MRNHIALAADIHEVFLQIGMPPDDRGAFRFLWWQDGSVNSELLEYRPRVYPFGANSSPFCATFTLLQTVEEFGSSFARRVSEILEKHFYVDDCLLPVGSAATTVSIVAQLRILLKTSGFNRTMWISNDRDVLNEISDSGRVAPVKAVTVPRLGLMAAVLSTEIAVLLRKRLMTPFDEEFCWTDSKIGLRYIQSATSHIQTFVANRLTTIHRNSEVTQWHHVRSLGRPADIRIGIGTAQRDVSSLCLLQGVGLNCVINRVGVKDLESLWGPV